MKILFAPDSFKGSISSPRAIELLRDVTRHHFPDCQLAGVSIGDGGGLERVSSIDLSGLHPGLRHAQITIMCDVSNPLLGPNGATYVYGPQKGADSQALRSGIETVLELLNFDALLEGVDLVVTGEGRLDFQSAQGKVLCGIGRACQKKGIPVCAIAGCFGDGMEDIYPCGISAAVSCTSRLTPPGEELKDAEARFLQAADSMYRMIKVGLSLKGHRQNSGLREQLAA